MIFQYGCFAITTACCPCDIQLKGHKCVPSSIRRQNAYVVRSRLRQQSPKSDRWDPTTHRLSIVCTVFPHNDRRFDFLLVSTLQVLKLPFGKPVRHNAMSLPRSSRYPEGRLHVLLQVPLDAKLPMLTYDLTRSPITHDSSFRSCVTASCPW